VINLDPEAAREVCVSVPDSNSSQPAELTWMKGKAVGSNNFSAWNGNAPEAVLLTRESSTLKGNVLAMKLPAHSMVGVTIPKTTK
jgi:alpha-L-arabinofuranosidase